MSDVTKFLTNADNAVWGTKDGEITVDGMESEYVYGITPPETKWNDCEPRVLSGSWKLDI